MILKPISALVLALSLGCAPVAHAEAPPIASSEAAGIETAAGTLFEALRLAEVMELTRREGIAYGKELETQFFPGAGGPAWQAEVARIYDPARLTPVFRQAFAEDLARTGAATDAMVAFVASPLGRQIAGLELKARETLLDKTLEEAGRLKYQELEAEGGSRLSLLQDLVAANHLIDMNVSSALNANMAFMRGMAAAGAFGGEMSEEEMLAEVWSQDEEVRGETETWLMTFVTLAYAPLSDAELGAYATFSASPDGAALNRALFAGFDAAYVKVSADLGRAVGQRMQGTTL
jgi:hypothetical protein